MTTTYNNIEQSPLWESTNLLEDYAIDLAIFSLKYPTYNNRLELIRKFWRS